MSSEMVSAAESNPNERAIQEWAALASQADEVIGYSLVGGKENEQTLRMLTGVPHIVESLTFRRGDVNIAAKGEPAMYRDYVSVSALIHPAYTANFRRPRVVYNDGSTGIYRQAVKYLASKGLITVDESLPEEGEAHSTRYDLCYTSERVNPDGAVIYPAVEFQVSLVVPEGLRVSEYKNSYGDSETYYWA
jgi:hypothetical protein